MGLKPRDLDSLSLWELNVLIHGWNEAHRDPNAPPPAPELTPELAEELGIDLDAQN